MHNMEESQNKNIIRYWRQCSIDAQLYNLSQVTLNQQELIDKSLLELGVLPAEITERLFMRANQLQAQEKNSLEQIPVLIAPWLARPRLEQQSHNEFAEEIVLVPLWIPVVLTWDGQLQPRSYKTIPWISRNLLDPSSYSFHLAKLRFLEQFLQEFQLPRGKNGELTWHELYRYANAMLDAASMNEWQNLLNEAGYDLLKVAMVMVDNEIDRILLPTIKIFDCLLSAPSLPILIEKITAKQTIRRKLLSDAINLQDLTHLHLAHSAKEPLSKASRLALYGLINLPDDNALAVNVAVGVNYTQLLADALGSNWVRAAIDKGKPPINIWTVNDQKSLWKIIHDINKNRSINRWLPEEIQGFATYLAANHCDELQAIAIHYQWLHMHGNELSSACSNLINDGFIHNAEAYFLQQCKSHLEVDIKDLSEATEAIHAKIIYYYYLLQEGIKNANHLQDLSRIFQDQYHGLGKFTKHKKEFEKKLQELVMNINGLIAANGEWRQIVNEQGWWSKVFYFLPSFQSKNSEIYKQFLGKYPCLQETLSAKHYDGNVMNRLQTILASLLHEYTAQNSQLAEMRKLEEAWLLAQQEWYKWLETVQGVQVKWLNYFDLEDPQGKIDKSNLLNWLDLAIRPIIFEWSLHYWEATWLKDIQLLSQKMDPLSRNELIWQLQAMLTPCFVANVHTLAIMFGKTDQDTLHYPQVENLIIDRAEQLSPESVIGLFAIAKKIIAVGDLYQYKVSSALLEIQDKLNAKKYCLVNNDEMFQQLIDSNIAVSGGTVLGLVQKISPWQTVIGGHEIYPGVLLTEQKNISHDILKFCKQLNPTFINSTENISDKIYVWPTFGLIEIIGEENWLATDCKNELEAKHLVMWLMDHYQLIASQAAKKYPDRPLEDLIRIVTPFARQRNIIQKLIDQSKIPVMHIDIFETISFPAASVTLFSPVYNFKQGYNLYLFDQSPKYLYTLATHTQDCLIVFGDKKIFDMAPAGLPSGILGQHLQTMPYFYELGNSINTSDKYPSA